jgi:hypothetical protein
MPTNQNVNEHSPSERKQMVEFWNAGCRGRKITNEQNMIRYTSSRWTVTVLGQYCCKFSHSVAIADFDLTQQVIKLLN